MQSVFVATPMYGGMCTGMFTQSLMQTVSVCMQNNIGMSFTCLMNESLIQRGRNTLAHAFLKSDATHLMFIDADIRFNPVDIVTMMQADKEIICGIYPKKEINWTTVRQAAMSGKSVEELKHYTGSFVVNLVNDAPSVTVPVNEPVEIQHGGTGFMLIKRHVLQEMAAKVPSYRNDVADLGNQTKGGERIAELFPVAIDPQSERLLSEDYAFCSMARKMGFKVWAAPWVKLAHIGTYIFEGNLVPAE